MIAREALEQCGGVVMPEIAFSERFPETTTGSVEPPHIVLDTI